MKKWILCLLMFSTLGLYGQITVNGTVVDGEIDDVLIGASVTDRSGNGVITDENGRFSMVTSIDDFPLTVSYVGYKKAEIILPKEFTGEVYSVNITLEPKSNILDLVVISGSRYEKNIADEPTSLEVIVPEFLQNNQITDLAGAMNYVPGVVMMDNQVNIRSSGYAFGAGSRVGLMVDGQPLLGPLQSDVLWGFIPIENAEQIEIMKGASSVLYGSAAMNGLINVITAKPTATPQTTITTYAGTTDSPASAYREWWQDTTRPYTAGVFLSHRQRIGKLDLVLGGNVHREKLHIAHLHKYRYRFNVNTTYHLSDKVHFGINANGMHNNEIQYIIWQDADTNALRSIGQDNPSRAYSYSIDPHLTIYADNGAKHTLNGRFLNGTIVRPKSPTNAVGYVGSMNYQYQQNFNEKTLVTGGLSGQIIKADDPRDETDTTQNPELGLAQLYAIYGQLDQKLWDNKVNVIMGLRAEYVTIGDEFQQWMPISRLSANYKIRPNHILRANFGQGYRIPSLIERYVESSLFEFESPFPAVSSINLIPNPDLLPEVGWSMEIGYKHLLNTRGWKGYVDAAVYQADYKNMVEFLFEFHKDLNRDWTLLDVLTEPELLGFRMTNINNGRIGGLELSANMEGVIGNTPVKIWGGYTYSYAANIDSLRSFGLNYYQTAIDIFGTVDSLERLTLLPYSNLHNGRLNVDFYLKKFTIGASANFYGYVPRIEPVFEEDSKWAPFVLFLNGGPIIPYYDDFLEESKGGSWVFDVRMNYEITDNHKLFLIVNNVFNKEYAVRPGRMNPLRTFNVKYQLSF